MASAARLSVQRLPALRVLIRQSCRLSLSSRHLPLLAQHSTKLFRRAQHQNALSPSPTDTRPLRPMNSLHVVNDLITPDLYTRTIAITNIPPSAVEDDLHELLAESGLKYERIIMFFMRTTGCNPTVVNVIMADESTAKAAVDELHGAALFDQKLGVRTFDGEMWKEKKHRMINFTWGWVASKVLNYDDPNLRAPVMKAPKDIFRPIREGRRVVVDFPSAAQVCLGHIYALFHSYNVDATSWEIKYTQKVGGNKRSCYQVDFSTREEADDAVRVFHNYKLKGCRLHVAKYQIPLKYLGASWDSGLPGAHFSGRDQGSAVGTNYEHLEEEILVKAILGRKDRKLWVPTHTY